MFYVVFEFYVIHMSEWAGHNQPKSSNSFKWRQNAPYSVILLSTVTVTLKFSNMVRKQQIASLFQNLQVLFFSATLK